MCKFTYQYRQELRIHQILLSACLYHKRGVFSMEQSMYHTVESYVKLNSYQASNKEISVRQTIPRFFHFTENCWVSKAPANCHLDFENNVNNNMSRN